MKTFLVLFVSALLATNVMAQQKGDNTILVKGVTFEQVVNTLLDAGFIIDKIDKDFKTIKTEFKDHSKYSFQVCYYVRVKNNTAVISGKAKNFNLTFDIENGKSGVDKYAFEDMNEFAKSLNGEISYTKR